MDICGITQWVLSRLKGSIYPVYTVYISKPILISDFQFGLLACWPVALHLRRLSLNKAIYSSSSGLATTLGSSSSRRCCRPPEGQSSSNRSRSSRGQGRCGCCCQSHGCGRGGGRAAVAAAQRLLEPLLLQGQEPGPLLPQLPPLGQQQRRR